MYPFTGDVLHRDAAIFLLTQDLPGARRIPWDSWGVIADGVLTGKLRSGTSVSHDSAPVRFAVVAKSGGGRCNVITLRLATLNLQLLGVQVTTSAISLDVYALKGRVLGDLFCALSRAKVSFPKAARDLNSRLHGRPLQVWAASDSLPAAHAPAPSPARGPADRSRRRRFQVPAASAIMTRPIAATVSP